MQIQEDNTGACHWAWDMLVASFIPVAVIKHLDKTVWGRKEFVQLTMAGFSPSQQGFHSSKSLIQPVTSTV